MALRVLSAVLFSPRGGSAHVARALVDGQRERGCAVTLVAGSRADAGGLGDARAFYGDVQVVDFGPALLSDAPMRYDGLPGTAPMHPSFEERPGAPDRVFAMLDDLEYERQVRAWSRELARAGAAGADVLHLHHLTPLNEAAARVAPRVPVVGHLHGTELLMLQEIKDGPPARWRHADRWAERLRGWAQRCSRVVVAPGGVERALGLLELPRGRVVPLPGGVDPERFRPESVDRPETWRRVLVEDPQGWRPGEEPGSVRYQLSDIERLASGTVLLYVGRFTAVKRLDRLIAAFGRAEGQLSKPAGLVLIGGHPGEWEGEHPAELAERLGVEHLFLAGWRAHESLPGLFAAADVVVSSASREQFGQFLIEAMACGKPPVATRSFGAVSIIEDGETGWLVDPDDEAALADALVDVVEHRPERERRGRAARDSVCERFTWSGVSATLADVLEEATRDVRHDAPAV